MVWRGEQYKRAITLYVAKFGKYPTKIEDLTRETNGVRFLRRAYTDPLNKEDGSWRFIYVVIPGGQLIGSLKSSSVLLAQPSTQGAGGSPFTVGPQGLPQLGAQAQQPGIGGPRSSISTTNLQNSQPQPLTGEVIGGNIIGVGSKINKPSIRVYLGSDNYQQWEFIASPNGQIAPPGAAPISPNGIPGTPPAGVNPNGIGPNGAPPVTPPNGTDPNAPGGQPQQPPPNQ